MWKALLILLALAVVFFVLLRLLEKWSQRGKVAAPRPRREVEGEREENADSDEPEVSAEGRIDELVGLLARGDATVAQEAGQKLLLIGPRAIDAMMPFFLEAQRNRREHEPAVVARRFEDTLAAFGPVAIRPCLNLMSVEKGSFEVFRGVRSVLAGIGEGAARPIIDAMSWLSEEGLYVRALVLLRSLGPGATSPLLRAIESAEGRAREIGGDLLLDFARFYPEAIRSRAQEAFLGAGKGVLASPEVRQALLAALRRAGLQSADLPLIGAATSDVDPRVRREAWLLVPQTPRAMESLPAGVPFDGEPSAAAAQLYALAWAGRPTPPEALVAGGRVGVALAGVRARAAAGADGAAEAYAELEKALLEGPLESRREAAHALAFAGGEEAGRILSRGLLQTPVPILGTVAVALGRTHAQAASASLFDLWEERGGNAVRRGVAALGVAAVPLLMEYVARRNPRLMESAALVLGELGAVARAPILALFRDCRAEDPALFAVELALEVQGAEAVADLLPFLSSDVDHLRETAAWVLSRIGGPEVTGALLAQLSRLEDRYPVLDFVKRGGDEVKAATRQFLEANPEHADAEALRQAL